MKTNEVVVVDPVNVIDVRPVQERKARSPMDVTEVGISTDERLGDKLKELTPMDATEVGMVTDVRFAQ